MVQLSDTAARSGHEFRILSPDESLLTYSGLSVGPDETRTIEKASNSSQTQGTVGYNGKEYYVTILNPTFIFSIFKEPMHSPVLIYRRCTVSGLDDAI